MPPKKPRLAGNRSSKLKLIASGWFSPTKAQLKRDVNRINRKLGSFEDRLKKANLPLENVRVVTVGNHTTIYLDLIDEREFQRRVRKFDIAIMENEFREYSKLATDYALTAVGIKRSEENKELIEKAHEFGQLLSSITFYSSGHESKTRFQRVSEDLNHLIGENRYFFFKIRYNSLIKKYEKHSPVLEFRYSKTPE